MITVLGVLILVCALFLIISVLLQSSKNHRMSGVVSGGAETFFGKQKGKTIDAKLSKITAVISVIFCILILVLYYTTAKANKADDTANTTTDDTIVADNAAIPGEDADVTPEAPADETAEDAAEAPADETAEDAAEAPADETAEGTTEEAPADETAEGTAEETPAE